MEKVIVLADRLLMMGWKFRQKSDYRDQHSVDKLSLYWNRKRYDLQSTANTEARFKSKE